jgi:hypothetical protein
VDGKVSTSKPLKVSLGKKEPKVLLGSECGGHGCSILTRHGHKKPSVHEEGPVPFRSHMRNTVSPYCSREGSLAVKRADGSAGRGWGRKRKPSCNGLDTGRDITRRESGQTSSWSSVTKELGKSANKVSR